jgi:hypothetical protein
VVQQGTNIFSQHSIEAFLHLCEKTCLWSCTASFMTRTECIWYDETVPHSIMSMSYWMTKTIWAPHLDQTLPVQLPILLIPIHVHPLRSGGGRGEWIRSQAWRMTSSPIF